MEERRFSVIVAPCLTCSSLCLSWTSPFFGSSTSEVGPEKVIFRVYFRLVFYH